MTQAHLAMVNATDWFEQDIMSLLPQLMASARSMCHNATDAEDLVAEAIAKAWRHRAALRDRAKLRGWLFRILSNTYLSARRCRATEPALLPLEDDSEQSTFSLFERLHPPVLLWWGNPEQEFLTRLLQEDLERALAALAEPYRLAVLLADVQGLAYQEIADVLDIPVGTVRSRLARGRSQLQRALWKHAQDAGITNIDQDSTAQ